jgi:hypothetical protein
MDSPSLLLFNKEYCIMDPASIQVQTLRKHLLITKKVETGYKITKWELTCLNYKKSSLVRHDYSLKGSKQLKIVRCLEEEEVLVELTCKQNQGSIVLLSMGKFQET